jgi:hypothetical protein
MNRQRWDDDTRQQAGALFIADSAKLASEVTGVPVRTVRQWAKVGNWRQQTPATGQPPDQRDTADTSLGAGATADAKGEDGQAAMMGPVNLPRELAHDLALARQVYRTEVERFLAGGGKASSVRDASVGLAVLLDKMAKHGGPEAGGSGREFTWPEHLADNEARRQRVLMMLRELLPIWRERAQVAGNGQHGG